MRAVTTPHLPVRDGLIVLMEAARRKCGRAEYVLSRQLPAVLAACRSDGITIHFGSSLWSCKYCVTTG